MRKTLILSAALAMLALSGCASKPLTEAEMAYWQTGCSVKLAPNGACWDSYHRPGVTVIHIKKEPGQVVDHETRPIWSRE